MRTLSEAIRRLATDVIKMIIKRYVCKKLNLNHFVLITNHNSYVNSSTFSFYRDYQIRSCCVGIY